MAWDRLAKSWVAGSLRPEVASRFGRWEAFEVRRSDQLHASYLLDARANRLRAIPSGDLGRELQCVTRARQEAEALARQAERDAAREASSLIAILRALRARSAGENLLFGYLLADRTPTSALRGDQGDEPRALLSAAGEDPTAPRELRARAEEVTARLELGGGRLGAGAAALQQVLALTRDDDLAIETRIKLADLAKDPGERENLLLEIVNRLDRMKPGQQRDQGAWRLAEVLADLAELELVRSAFERARNHAVRCAREVPRDFEDDPDPWGCATTLAGALTGLGGARKGLDVPLPFLGPLALALMRTSFESLDRDEARRAGELAFARLPAAKETPAILASLASITGESAARAALQERRARAIDAASAWTLAQRARLGALPAAGVARELAELTSPPVELGRVLPADELSLRAEFEQRLWNTVGACREELAPVKRDLELRIDTTGPVPGLAVSGASESVRRCLGRAIRSAFRSVGPATITVTLHKGSARVR
jgi:hypothetical protein